MINKTKTAAYGVVMIGCLLFWAVLITILVWGA